jgi:opine dehydrogenase
MVSALGDVADVVVPGPEEPGWLADLVPFGLVPLTQLSRTLGVATPVMDALVDVAGALLGNDYWLGGRTLTDESES